MSVCPVRAAVETWQNNIRETIVQKVKVWSRWCHSSPVKAKPRLSPQSERIYLCLGSEWGRTRLPLPQTDANLSVGPDVRREFLKSPMLVWAAAVKGERICVWGWKKERLHKYLNVYVCVCGPRGFPEIHQQSGFASAFFYSSPVWHRLSVAALLIQHGGTRLSDFGLTFMISKDPLHRLQIWSTFWNHPQCSGEFPLLYLIQCTQHISWGINRNLELIRSTRYHDGGPIVPSRYAENVFINSTLLPGHAAHWLCAVLTHKRTIHNQYY